MQDIPVKLLAEAQMHIVTVELSSGESYRGTLVRSEDNMNVQMRDVAVTARDGQVSHKDLVFVRGSHIKMIVLPEMLQYAPLFRPDTLERSRGTRKFEKR